MKSIAPSLVITALASVGTISLLNSTATAATNWGGYYIGGFTGFGNSDSDWSGVDDSETSPTVNVSAGLEDDGLVVGGFAGYNFVSTVWVYGVEVDAAHFQTYKHVYLDGSEGLDLTSTTDAIGTVRARLGYAMGDHLIFVSAGWAWVDASHTWNDGGEGLENGDPVTVDTNSGWVVGGGVELATIEQVSIRAEGYYYDFGSESGIATAYGEIDTFSVDHTASVFRLGVGYHF